MKLKPQMEAVLAHDYHGPKLRAMLKEWASIRMWVNRPLGLMHADATLNKDRLFCNADSSK